MRLAGDISSPCILRGVDVSEKAISVAAEVVFFIYYAMFELRFVFAMFLYLRPMIKKKTPAAIAIIPPIGTATMSSSPISARMIPEIIAKIPQMLYVRSEYSCLTAGVFLTGRDVFEGETLFDISDTPTVVFLPLSCAAAAHLPGRSREG